MLFTAAAGPAPLVGIARLAAQSPLLEAKSRVEYFELEARSILNKCSSPRMPFPFTINPYRGCEFGCRYCYARYTHTKSNLIAHDAELLARVARSNVLHIVSVS